MATTIVVSGRRDDAGALTAALQSPRVGLWLPVTAGLDEGGVFESIHLWLASQPRAAGVLTVDRDRVGELLDPDNRFTCLPCWEPPASSEVSISSARTGSGPTPLLWRLSSPS